MVESLGFAHILCVPLCRAAVITALGLIAGKEVASRIQIRNVEDGSSVGAACLASAAGSV